MHKELEIVIKPGKIIVYEVDRSEACCGENRPNYKKILEELRHNASLEERYTLYVD